MNTKGLNVQKLRTAITDIHTWSAENVMVFVGVEDQATMRRCFTTLKNILDSHQELLPVGADVVSIERKIKTPNEILDDLGVK